MGSPSATMLLLLAAITSCCSSGAVQWAMHELDFTAASTHPDPFDSVAIGFHAIWQHTSSQAMTTPGFWASGQSWKVRFSPPAAGVWQWRTTACGNTSASAADPGLCGRKGTLTVRPPRQNESNLLLKHGGFLRTRDGHFTYTDGTSFFWLADTWWDEPGIVGIDNFTTMVRAREAQRFSVAQIHGCRSGWHASHAINCTEAIAKPGAASAAYFAMMDTYYRAAAAAGLVLIAGFDVGDRLSTVANAHVLLPKLFAYCVARYGAWPMSFLFTQEYNVRYYGPTDVPLLLSLGSVVRDADPYARALSMHPAIWWDDTHDAWEFSWYDFAMMQAGHLMNNSAATLAAMFTNASRRSAGAVPFVNSEANYEGFVRTAAEEVPHEGAGSSPQRGTPSAGLDCFRIVNSACVRDTAWSSVQSGSAGFTYGAQGLCASVLTPSAPGPTAAHGPVLTWQQGLTLEGGSQMQHLVAFYRDLVGGQRWPVLRPCGQYAAGQVLVTCDAATRDAYAAYLRSPAAAARFNVSWPGSRWSGQWYDTRLGLSGEGHVWQAVSDAAGWLQTPSPPSLNEDWMLWLTRVG
jgi:hypothetical protein